MSARACLIALLLPLLAGGCRRPDDQRTDQIRDRDVLAARQTLDPAVVEALDSGNVAYRERDYSRALGHYQAAVEMDRDVAAGWFGIYMAQLALGNAEAAEAAMQQARQRAPGASLIQPDEDLPVPRDHPALPQDQP
jgi:tetratricopeptide (TPR) repeat protein